MAVAGRGVAWPRWVDRGWPGLPLGAGLPCQGVRLWSDITRPGRGTQLALRVCCADVVNEVRSQLGCPRFWGKINAKRECPGPLQWRPSRVMRELHPQIVPSRGPAQALHPSGPCLLLCEKGMVSLFLFC